MPGVLCTRCISAPQGGHWGSWFESLHVPHFVSCSKERNRLSRHHFRLMHGREKRNVQWLSDISFSTESTTVLTMEGKWSALAWLFGYFFKNCVLGSTRWTDICIIGSRELYLQTECFRQSLLHNTNSKWLFSNDHKTPSQKLFQLKRH